MGAWKKDLYNNRQLSLQYRVSENIAEGAVVMRDDTAASPGEVENADAATAALNCLGCAEHAATYSATQGAVEGVVRLCPQPFAIYEFIVSGGATVNTPLSATSPGQILTNSTASTTGLVVSSTAVGTIDMSGGLIKGRTGANKGAIRKQTTHNNNADTNVIVPFPNDIAANDTFIRVPFSSQAIAMQTTTDFTQADGAIAFGTGIPCMVYDTIIDEERDRALVQVVFRTHLYNSLA